MQENATGNITKLLKAKVYMQWLELHEDKVGMTPKDRTPKSFVPREIYSRYLKSTLQEEARQAKKVDFREIHDEAVEVHMLNEGTVQVNLFTV